MYIIANSQSRTWMAIAKAVQEATNWPIHDIHRADLPSDVSFKDMRVVNVGTHTFIPNPRRLALAESLKECEYLIAAIDDYSFGLPTQIRHAVAGKPNIMLTNQLDKMSYSSGKTWEWVETEIDIDLSRATYEPVSATRKEYDFIYYGAYREDRVDLFEKFLMGTEFDIHISAGRNAMKKFLDLNCLIHDHPKQKDLLGFLSQFKMSLIATDKWNETHPHFPANRFYECLSAKVGMVFDESCIPEYALHGIDVRPFAVRSHEDIEAMLKDWIGIIEAQYLEWAEDRYYRQDLIKELKELLCT